jgi:hypothetical protein
MSPSRKTEYRTVRSADPSLSDEANRLLTREAREIVGRDEVDVAVGRADPAHDRHGTHGRWVADLIAERIGYVVAAMTAVVVLAILAIATKNVLVLVGALVVLLGATGVVVRSTLGLTRETQHAGPELSARLEEEGVGDPDRLLTELVDEFTDPGRDGPA